MHTQLYSSTLSLSDDHKDFVISKIEALQKYENRIADESTQIRIDVEKNKVKTSREHIELQVTMFVPHAVIRSEVTGVTVEEATDKSVEKLKKQIERYKSQRRRRDREGSWIPESTLEEISTAHEESFAVDMAKIMKRKKFDHLKPMHEDEAVEQMELLGHDFFAFLNADTNLFSVLYKREEAEGYGLIELDTTTV